MKKTLSFILTAFSAACLQLHGTPVAADNSSASQAAGIEFFESRIRPILVEHCYQCHSSQSEKIKGGLRVDTRETLLKGGDSGPAIVPGKPEESLLVKAVRYTDPDLQMPPKDKKLSGQQIADLESWIQLGAPDPRTDNPGVSAAKPSSAADHWAFQPIQNPPIPAVKNSAWIQTPIDAFILAKLEAANLPPSPRADKRTLIRRATLDLTGLPPTPDEVADFLQDDSSEAWQRVVERLLASPRYGERWARHWLDIARYADTKGYVFEEERRFPYSYTYRDYVIRAFNEDLPYNQFLIEQLAADQLPLGDDKRSLAALGFLTLGRRFLNNQNDIIDDRIDVVTRGTMGLTVSCARCHDHKFDPIPIADYYSLHGVFASSTEPAEKPLLGQVAQLPGFEEYLAERKKREAELNQFRDTKEAEALTQLRQRSGDYLLAAHEGMRLADGSKVENLARQRKLHPPTVQRWINSLQSWAKPEHPIFGPWARFAQLSETNFQQQAHPILLALATQSTNSPQLNPLVSLALAGEAPKTIKDIAERYGKLFADIDQRWLQTLESFKAAQTNNTSLAAVPTAFANPHLEELRKILHDPDSPTAVPPSEIMRLFDVPTAQKVRALRRKVEELDATHPGAPARAMALHDLPNPRNSRIFLRGNPNNPGPEVPRQFLSLLAGNNRKPFEKGSGRLELAQAIASPHNPLTARVFVNRVWLLHFGAGLVRTPSDFGVRCDPPSHPELLDHLAYRFMQENWSVKQLHRTILLSSVYQQSSEPSPLALQQDPANLLLSHMNRRRLELEAMRDSLLMVSGQLDLKTGGRPVDITSAAPAPRRTVYGFVERQNLPGLFRVFDFASPDTTSPQRFFTTIPQQALFMLNSPFVLDQARSFYNRPEIRSIPDPSDRIRQLYQLALQRDPTPDELALGLKFIESQPQPGGSSPDLLNPWEQYAQVLLMSNELVFMD